MRAPRSSLKLLRIVFFSIIGLSAVYAAASLIAVYMVRDQLAVALEGMGSKVAPGRDPQIDIVLLTGSLRITSLSLDSTGFRARSLQGEVDTLEVRGLSYWGLLRDEISVEHVLVRAQQLRISLGTDSARTKNRGPIFNSIAVRDIDVRLRDAEMTWTGPSALGGHIGDLHFLGNGFVAARNTNGTWSLRLPGTRRALRADSLIAVLHGEQRIELGSINLDQAQGSCSIAGIRFGPLDKLDHFASTRKVELDVARGDLPLVAIRGFVVAEDLSQPRISARLVSMDSARVDIYRDKTRPDPPHKVKPLLARLLRQLPPDCGVDSVVINDLDITYHERASTARGFARIPFLALNAVVTGAKNTTRDTSICAVIARCSPFGAGTMDFNYKTWVHDTTDRFTAEARVGRMPFTALNSAFGPLMEIQMSSGILDTLVFRMHGGDRTAQGHVRLAYHNLHLVKGTAVSAKTRNRPVNWLINAVVPGKKELGNEMATDAEFTVERQRGRSMFNYLWIGLREGSKQVLLPGVLTP